MKISKSEAAKAKADARRDKQAILGQAKKNLSTQDKAKIRALNAVVDAADKIIEGK